MYTQSQQDCDHCDGRGEIIKRSDLCKKCAGQKVLTKTEIVDVPIEVGCPHKEKIVVKGKGNEHPEAQAGDLVVIVTIKENSKFERRGDDLYIKKKIGLIDALKGIKFNLEHINDHKITLQTPQGKILTHGETLRIPNLGMPHYKDSMSNGDLYVEFDVVFPKKLTEDQLEALGKVLPGSLLGKYEETKNTYDFEAPLTQEQ